MEKFHFRTDKCQIFWYISDNYTTSNKSWRNENKLYSYSKGAFVRDQSGIRIIGIMQVSVCLGAILIPEYLDFHSGYSALGRNWHSGIYSYSGISQTNAPSLLYCSGGRKEMNFICIWKDSLNSQLQKRERTGTSFLYWFNWKSKHFNWTTLEWKAPQPSLIVFSEKMFKWEPRKSCKTPYKSL